SVSGIKDGTIKAIWSRQFDWASSNFRTELVSIRSDKVKISRGVAQAFGELVIERAQSSIEATSYVDPGKWWSTPEGEIYLNKNREAVRRGVRVRRIFVFRTADERAALDGILKAQKEAGIEVFICDVSRLPGRLQKDVIIMDGKLSGELAVADNGDFSSVVV